MKKVNSKSYLAGAILCLLCLLGIIYYCFFTSFSTYEDTQYIYIDQDDTADSVCVKLQPYGNAAKLSAFSTLARMTGYGDHIRTGKYAVPANENVLTIFRHIKNGRQVPVRLTIPECRTMDRLADIIFADYEKDERMKLLDLCCGYENEYLIKHGGILYPELEETLVRLKEKYPLYIVSNCQQGYIEAFLEHFGFGKYFDDIECYGNNLKEKGDNIALVIERNKLERAFYIGDIQGDCNAAENAGCGFIHAAYGFGEIDHPVPELQKFSDLPELLEDLCTD